MKYISSIFVIILLSTIGLGQVQTPQWDVILPSKVKWLQVNDWGMVIAACENGMYGMDPRDGKKIWENTSLTNINEDFYSNIENTPLVLIADKGSDAKTVVINGLTGDVVFNSEKEGFSKVVSRKIIPEIEGLLIVYQTDAGDGIALYNYVNGTQKWNSSIEKAKSNAVQPEPFLDNGQNIVMANGPILYHIDASSGSILWNYEVKKNIIDVFTGPTGNELYTVSGSPSDSYRNNNTKSSLTVTGGTGKFSIDCIALADGSSIWKNPIEYSKSKYGGVALGEDDFFLLHTLGANQYKYSSSDPIWKKEKLGTGGDALGGIFESDESIIYFSPDGAGRTYGYLVDKAGNQLWKKKVIINGDLMLLEDLGDTFFYLSTQGLNFINKADGKLLWEGNKYLSSNFPVDFIQENASLYTVYIGNKLISVDLDTKDWSLITNDILFQGEVPSRLRKTDLGYVISGDQNVMLVNENGKEIYRTYLPQPEQSFGAKLALGTLSMATAVGSMAYGMSSAGYGLAGAVQDNDQYKKKAQRQLAVASFTAQLVGGFDALATLRFGQSVGSSDYQLILTRKDKAIGFVKVGLDDGAEQGVIVTDDRTPTYVLDHVDNKFFLKSGDTRVACYQL